MLCPAGTFGDLEGVRDEACSGPCPAGKEESFGGVILPSLFRSQTEKQAR